MKIFGNFPLIQIINQLKCYSNKFQTSDVISLNSKFYLVPILNGFDVLFPIHSIQQPVTISFYIVYHLESLFTKRIKQKFASSLKFLFCFRMNFMRLHLSSKLRLGLTYLNSEHISFLPKSSIERLRASLVYPLAALSE